MKKLYERPSTMVVEMTMEGVICNGSNYAPAMNPVFWLEGTEEANGTLLDGGTLN